MKVCGQNYILTVPLRKTKIIDIRDKLAGALEDEDLRALRKSGGLKKDLQWIMVALGKNTLIYQGEAIKLVHAFVNAQLHPDYPGIGKARERKRDRSHTRCLEKLRTGKRKTFLVESQHYVRIPKFSTISGLPELFMEELESILESLICCFQVLHALVLDVATNDEGERR